MNGEVAIACTMANYPYGVLYYKNNHMPVWESAFTIPVDVMEGTNIFIASRDAVGASLTSIFLIVQKETKNNFVS